MATMQTKHVNITERQDQMLQQYARDHGISFSEALRRALDAGMETPKLTKATH